ncbi:MAG: hypothetical protein LIO67_08390 [Lachnospiraceae bacterium]|nr:hypothetical protein [Lachnospiraceae bacterium]
MKTFKGRLLFWLSLLVIILLAVGVLFMPRMVSRWLDEGRLNTVELAGRDQFQYLEQSSDNVLDIVEAFSYLDNGGELLLLSTLEGTSALGNSDLIESVYDQVIQAANDGMLVWISEIGYDAAYAASDEFEPTEALYEDWSRTVRSAKYYSLTYDTEEADNTREMLNFWYLNFSDGTNYDYSFLVNASSYQIYYAEIYNSCTNYGMMLALDYLADEDREAITVQRALYDEEGGPEHEDGYYGSLAFYENRFFNGCIDYYNASDGRYVQGGSGNDYNSMTVLHMQDGTVYVEQQMLQSSGWYGIGVGFRSLGDSVRKLLQ